MKEKVSYYFKHDSNSRHDPKMIRLLLRKKASGYGVYWIIIEMLRESASYQLSTQDYDVIAEQAKVDLKDVKDVVENFGLFVIEDDTFYAERLTRDMQKLDGLREKWSQAGRKGGLTHAKTEVKLSDNIRTEHIKPKKEKKDLKFEYPQLQSKAFETTFNNYLESRKKKATEHAKELLLKDLQKHSLDIAIKMLEQSIKNGWTGVFELKEKTEYQQNKPSQSMVRKYPTPSKNCGHCKGDPNFRYEVNGESKKCWCWA